jgi:uncharacterized protein YdhG (YjbR/CyaY superfamily)
METIDSYFKTIQPAQKAALERIRKIIKQTVPEAEETISYGMPAFKYRGKRLIYFAAYKKHMSLFGGLGSMEKKLGSFKLSHKGTLQFTEDNPVPEAVIKEIILNRLAEISKA